MKYSRLISAKVPVEKMIEMVTKHLHAIESNPKGVDNLSQTGYSMILNNLRAYQYEIDNGGDYENRLWDILREAAPWLTHDQYVIMLDYGKQVTGYKGW